MLMKKSRLAEIRELMMTALRFQVIENKVVENSNRRLGKPRGNIAKMKVYPEMLMKTKDRIPTVLAQPVMLNKNKGLRALSRDVDENKWVGSVVASGTQHVRSPESEEQ